MHIIINKLTALVLASYVLFLLLSDGCATVSTDRVTELWDQVRSQYKNCPTEMPTVVWVKEPIYVNRDGVDYWCYGAYNKDHNTVLLKEYWAGERTVMHEFRHACGDDLGEHPGKLAGDTSSKIFGKDK